MDTSDQPTPCPHPVPSTLNTASLQAKRAAYRRDVAAIIGIRAFLLREHAVKESVAVFEIMCSMRDTSTRSTPWASTFM